jgi:hypothetical protein
MCPWGFFMPSREGQKCHSAAPFVDPTRCNTRAKLSHDAGVQNANRTCLSPRKGQMRESAVDRGVCHYQGASAVCVCGREEEGFDRSTVGASEAPQHTNQCSLSYSTGLLPYTAIRCDCRETKILMRHCPQRLSQHHPLMEVCRLTPITRTRKRDCTFV